MRLFLLSTPRSLKLGAFSALLGGTAGIPMLASQVVASEPAADAAATESVERATPEAPAAPERVVLPGAESAEDARTVTIDLRPITGEDREVEVTYNLDEVTRSVSMAEVKDLPEWVVGTRLLLGEVGMGRLVKSRWSLVEGVGILQTVRHRLDPAVSNPLGVDGIASWPGCGPDDTFQSCVDPKEYLGIATGQALKPAQHASGEALLGAVDRAVTAWHLFEGGYLGDVTNGATSFVHRCGGAVYGATTPSCDGVGRDAPGANPSTGPVVFKKPGSFSERGGFYQMEEARAIDYEAGDLPQEPAALAAYVSQSDDGIAGLE